ncbi:Aldehyde dehydrogenase N-terminal [Penicillium expansum]|nr:Aldehyde dehydrogenase N-terminal [Penicillium expansum]
MSNLFQKITAPNGVAYEQPLGLFINNKWVTSSNGQKIVSINPTVEPSLRLFQSMPRQKKMLIQPSVQPVQHLRARPGMA